MFHSDSCRRKWKSLLPWSLLLAIWGTCSLPVRSAEEQSFLLEKLPGARPRNIIFILVDDHRYDALGFMGHPFLKTPHLDSLAHDGAHLKNAFVTTSLCSPSRASILTGQYMHRHRVVDNNSREPAGTIFFPQYLQAAGYATGFFGKWHMGGEGDEPRPGFDRWVSFRGQGRYNPPADPSKWSLNVDGRRLPQKGYITDELTDYALTWLDGLPAQKPFFLYLSHKAVHAEFEPAPRHSDLYKDAAIPTPATQADTPKNYAGKPMWVKNQRNSWHGVDFPYHSDLDVKEFYRRYCQTLAGVDESVGRILEWLTSKGLDRSTLIVYMGDNGFMFGEHGLIDKRNAYEESMRVPMLGRCPELIPAGTVVEPMVANIDVAPTLLAAAGLAAPDHMDGANFLPLFAGGKSSVPWREQLLYEYYWEYNYPQTPTMFALRGDRYKFIQYFGIWDSDELYDLQSDPRETKNLIRDPAHAQIVESLRQKLYAELRATGGMAIPLGEKRGPGANLRRIGGSPVAEFPPEVMRQKSSQQ